MILKDIILNAVEFLYDTSSNKIIYFIPLAEARPVPRVHSDFENTLVTVCEYDASEDKGIIFARQIDVYDKKQNGVYRELTLAEKAKILLRAAN